MAKPRRIEPHFICLAQLKQLNGQINEEIFKKEKAFQT